MPKAGIDFNNLVFFGDSLTDNGNLYGLTSQVFGVGQPTSPPYDRRFSNGPTYAEFLPALIGVTSADIGPTGWTFAGDDNFAYGGARAVTNNDGIPDLRAQIAEFDLRYPTGAPDGTAAMLLIGNNDYFNYNPATNGDPTAFVGTVLQNVTQGAIDLAQRGVDKIILLTLPNVAATPLVAANPAAAALDQLIDGHNAGLQLVAAGLAAQGIQVEIIDNNAFVKQIAADPETFGFLAPLSIPVVDGAGQPTGITSQFALDEIAFFDAVHPTTAAHGVSASFVSSALMADTTTFASANCDYLNTGSGNDLIFSSAGDDFVNSGNGNDTVFAGTGDDFTTGGNGNDILAGGSGADFVSGGNGIDVVAGNAGNDILDGGVGDDVMILGRGSDTAFGGRGNDLFYVTDEATANDHDYADGGLGFDTLFLELSQTTWQSVAFQTELAAYNASGGHPRFGFFTFDAVDLTIRGIEHIDVIVGGQVVAMAGAAGQAPTAAVAAAVASADLWGLI
jgi:phospholipase/lecithinase/hemolysin